MTRERFHRDEYLPTLEKNQTDRLLFVAVVLGTPAACWAAVIFLLFYGWPF